MTEQCIGVMGTLFGHKFYQRLFLDFSFHSDTCLRCGRPKG